MDDDLATLDDPEATDTGAEGEAAPGAEAEGGAEGEQASADDQGEVQITIGDEPPAPEAEEQARAPDWVRELRKQNREKDRRIRELEAKVSAPAQAAPAVVLGPKPTLKDDDIAYDEDKLAAAMDAYYDRKRQIDEQQRAADEAKRKGQAEWQTRLDAYGKAKGALKVKDFDDAEESAKETLSVVQQGLIINGADDPAKLMYVLGKNPKRARELAAIADPVRFAFAVAKLETQLKTTPAKTAPAPERSVRGSAPVSGGSNAALEKLQAEADRTGDRSKVAAYYRANPGAR